MTPLQPVITSAGLAALFRSDHAGVEAKITHMAFGDGSGSGYEPQASQRALVRERAVVGVGGGERVSSREIEVQALFDTGPSFWMREIGFIVDGQADSQGNYIDGTGTMLAIWSDPDVPLGYKTQGVPLAVAYYLALEAIPPGSVNILVTGPSVNLTIVGPFAQLSAEIIRLQRRADESEVVRVTPEIENIWS